VRERARGCARSARMVGPRYGGGVHGHGQGRLALAPELCARAGACVCRQRNVAVSQSSAVHGIGTKWKRLGHQARERARRRW
jgi:hypothetical protein